MFLAIETRFQREVLMSSEEAMKAHVKVGLLVLAVMSIATFPACWTYSLHPIAEDNDPISSTIPHLKERGVSATVKVSLC
jgi:hypothetical protein